MVVTSSNAQFFRRVIPRPVLDRIPRGYRPWELRRTVQSWRTRARLYWKFEKSRHLEMGFYLSSVLGGLYYVQFKTPIEFYIRTALINDDPNVHLRDPFLREIENERDKRNEEMRNRKLAEASAGDEIAQALRGYSEAAQNPVQQA